MVPDQVEQDTYVAAPVEHVWACITEPEHLRTWLAFGGAKIDLRQGGRVLYRESRGDFRGEIVRLQAPHHLSVRHALVWGEPPRPGNSTVVDFTLLPEEDGTRLRVVERGFRNLAMSPEEQAQHVEASEQVWRDAVELLRDHAAHEEV